MENENKLVSIVMPSYNAELHLDRSIKSVLNQSYLNYELIIVDDGSSDNSFEVCKKYAHEDMRIKVFSKENGGPASARNYAINNMSGEYVMFLDADDCLSKDALEKFVNEIEYSKSDFVCSGHFKYFFDGAEPITMSAGKYTGEIQHFLERISVLTGTETIQAPWAKIFKSDIINSYNIRFPEAMVFGEDTSFVYEYLTHISKVSMIENPLYYHSIYSGSLSKRLVKDIIEVYIELYSKLMYLMKIHEVHDFEYQLSILFMNSILHGLSVVFRVDYNLNKCKKKQQIEILLNSQVAQMLLVNHPANGIQSKVVLHSIRNGSSKLLYFFFNAKEKIRYIRNKLKRKVRP